MKDGHSIKFYKFAFIFIAKSHSDELQLEHYAIWRFFLHST